MAWRRLVRRPIGRRWSGRSKRRSRRCSRPCGQICFTAYYESPFVHEAIRSLGFAYNATPLPKGYGLKRFDPETDAPRHGRGYYVPTEAVGRVDLSGLDIKELRHGQ
jgi:hypothetical protein